MSSLTSGLVALYHSGTSRVDTYDTKDRLALGSLLSRALKSEYLNLDITLIDIAVRYATTSGE
jgi:hypothetical protein